MTAVEIEVVTQTIDVTIETGQAVACTITTSPAVEITVEGGADLSAYLPLAGGTMTGPIAFDNNLGPLANLAGTGLSFTHESSGETASVSPSIISVGDSATGEGAALNPNGSILGVAAGEAPVTWTPGASTWTASAKTYAPGFDAQDQKITNVGAPTTGDDAANKTYVDSGDSTNATNLTNHLNDTSAAHAASAISSTPAGNLSATDVQAALAELDSEKLATGLAILLSLIDAKGDLIVGTADNTAARLGVGSDFYPLVGDSSTTPGLAWLLPLLTSGAFGAVGMASGRYYPSHAPTANITMTAGTAVYVPVFFARACTLDYIAVSLQTSGGASSTIRLGLYVPHATTGLPDAVLADFGTVSGNGTGIRPITPISQAVKAGMYWAVIAPQGTGSPVLRGSALALLGQTAGDTASTNFDAGTAALGLTQTSVTGALATASVTGVAVTGGQSIPSVLVRAT